MKIPATLMYAIIWAMLIVVMPWPREPRWAEVEEMFARNRRKQQIYMQQSVQGILDDISYRRYYEGSLSFQLDAYHRAQAFLRYSEAVCDTLATKRQAISTDSRAYDDIGLMLDRFLDRGFALYRSDGIYSARDRFPIRYIIEDYYFRNRSDAHDRYQKWAESIFADHNKSARRAVLSALESDLRTTAFIFLEHLRQQMIPRGFYFNPIVVMAIPANSYALPGEKVDGNILLATQYRLFNSFVSASNGKVWVDEDRTGHWRATTTQPGQHTVHGSVEVAQDTTIVRTPWSFEYRVIPRYASITLDKSYTLHRGVPAPLAIDAPSYPPSALTLRIPGARVEKTDASRYLIHTNRHTPQRLTAYLIFRTREGPDTICIQPLTVHPAPLPRAAFLGVEGSTLGINSARALSGVVLRPLDEDADASGWKMQRYTLRRLRPGGDDDASVTTGGTAWTEDPAAGSLLQDLHPGDLLLLENITAQGPDGGAVELPGILLHITE